MLTHANVDFTSSLVNDTVEDLTPRNICQPGASFAAMVAGDSLFGVDAGVFPCRGTGVEAVGGPWW